MKLVGPAIRISVRPHLCVARGRIVESGGTEVHAATFIRKRYMVLDAALLDSDAELRRILIHELFHFVWVRLGNPLRKSFEALLAGQWAARGELGWSSESRKRGLMSRDVRDRTRPWREYCCEAFCDTAAYLFARSRRHAEFTLAHRHRRKRIEWFGKNLASSSVRI
jgi:hypothetical protein